MVLGMRLKPQGKICGLGSVKKNMAHSLKDLCREFVSNVETVMREQIRQEILFAIEHPSREKMRHEAKVKARRKRSTREVDQLATSLYDKVVESPGSTIEELSDRMGRSTQDLRLPMLRLLDSSQVRKEGTARGTRYYQPLTTRN